MASVEIELKNVGLWFDNTEVLRNINLQIHRGEKVAVIGPSGSGKSSLLKILAGILSPSTGRVILSGQDFSEISEESKAQLRGRMGMLFQRNALFDSLTAIENVAFPMREVTPMPENEIVERSLTFLSAVGLSGAEKKYPNELSGGMQKRLGIARALALNPEIIFYDDPTAGLDPITSRKIIELIIEVQSKRHSTSIIVTNEINRAYQFADRIFMVCDRDLVWSGPAKETANNTDPRVRQFVRGELFGPLTQEDDLHHTVKKWGDG